MTRRTERVAALLHQEVAAFLNRIELPSLTTVSKVDVSPDLKWCKIWITIMDSDKHKKVLDQIDENLRELQDELYEKLEMKFVPKVSFYIDHGEEYASRINELIRKTHEDQ